MSLETGSDPRRCQAGARSGAPLAGALRRYIFIRAIERMQPAKRRARPTMRIITCQKSTVDDPRESARGIKQNADGAGVPMVAETDASCTEGGNLASSVMQPDLCSPPPWPDRPKLALFNAKHREPRSPQNWASYQCKVTYCQALPIGIILGIGTQLL